MAAVVRLEDLVVAEHHTSISTRSRSNSTRRRRRPQRSPGNTKHPSSQRRSLPPPLLITESTAKIHRRTYNPIPGGAAPHHQSYALLSDIISRRLSFVRVFHSPPDFAFGFIGDLPNSAWQLFGLEQEPVYLTSESLEDGGNGGGGVGNVAYRLHATLLCG